jgi:hypothetical protein
VIVTVPALCATLYEKADRANMPLVDESDAEQEAVIPPLEPVQLQVHGPAPATDEADPVEQRFVAGALLTVVPFAEPQVPFTAVPPPARADKWDW